MAEEEVPELMTVKETAEYLRIPLPTVYYLVQRGQLPAIQIGGRWRIKRSLLDTEILKKDEGGRHTPFFTGYRPQFYFRTTDVTGTATLQGAEMCMPGDNITMDIELIQPIAMKEGLRFAIREGGRTVGSGVVTAITEE